MATPQYDNFKSTVRDWANKREAATVPDSVIEACIRYGQDLIYRKLRIPQMEYTTVFNIEEANNSEEDLFTILDVPQDLVEFIYLRRVDQSDGLGVVYNQVPDIRTFLDPWAQQYSRERYVWKDLKIYIFPKLAVGDRIELHYYRRLPQVNSLYSVIAANFDSDFSTTQQPLLTVDNEEGTPLYLVSRGGKFYAFDSTADQSADIAANGGSPSTVLYVGKEAWNWLRDSQEWMLIFASLSFVGAYLFDDAMEAKYLARTEQIINMLNSEDKFRKAKGGNVQMNVNTGGMI